MWAAGGVIVPFVIQPFLVNINVTKMENSRWNASHLNDSVRLLGEDLNGYVAVLNDTSVS